MLLVVFLLWIAFGAVVGMFASSRGRDFASWLGIGLLISPIVAIVILAVIPEGTGHVPVAQPPLLDSATASDLLERVEKLFDRGALTPFDVQRIKILAARELRRHRRNRPRTSRPSSSRGRVRGAVV